MSINNALRGDKISDWFVFAAVRCAILDKVKQ